MASGSKNHGNSRGKHMIFLALNQSNQDPSTDPNEIIVATQPDIQDNSHNLFSDEELLNMPIIFEDNTINNNPEITDSVSNIAYEEVIEVTDEVVCDIPDTQIQVANRTPKLVDYDSSSGDESGTNIYKGHSIKLLPSKRKSSSGRSFSSRNSSGDSDSTEDESSNDEMVVGKRGFRRKKNMSVKNRNKFERNYGKGKSVQPNPCKLNCQHKCGIKFANSVRHDIHEFYWGLGSFERQRSWLLSCIKDVPISRRMQNPDNSRRTKSYKYYIKWNDEETEVCQQFLLKTLDISQMVLRYAKDKAIQSLVAKPDQRGRHPSYKKTSEERRTVVHDFIKKLPAVPSHYCRNKTTRKYLQSDLRNVSFLYRIFLKDQLTFHNRTDVVVSLKVFRDIFKKDFNLGFHLPKKDKCAFCESHKGQESETCTKNQEAFEEHLRIKEQSKTLFLEDQKKFLSDQNFLCASFDLQKVLNTPHGDNLLLYYSRKYAFYNETVYESGVQNGFCYIWGEADGNRGANEICTVMYDYLKQVDSRGSVTSVALYCDSCAGQNKNRAMLSMLFTFINTSQTITEIKLVYLLPGHTYMPVDSVHGTIERFIKRRIVWAPSEWENIIGNSRTKPHPFVVKKLSHCDFQKWKNWGDEIIKTTTRTTAGEAIKITQIRRVFFEKGKKEIRVNYFYNDEEENTDKIIHLPIPKNGTSSYSLHQVREYDIQLTNHEIQKSFFFYESHCVLKKPPRAYRQKLPISLAKKKDLVSLCTKNVIPTRFRNEFHQMKSTDFVPDTLPESDAEDEIPSDIE